MWGGIELTKYKCPHHSQILTSNKEVWADHVEYILGPEVKDLQNKDMDGGVVKTPSWALVLHYNQEIFNKVAELMNEGIDGNGYIHPYSGSRRLLSLPW